MLDSLRPEGKNADAGDAPYAAGIARMMDYDGAMPAAGLQSCATRDDMLKLPAILWGIVFILWGLIRGSIALVVFGLIVLCFGLFFIGFDFGTAPTTKRPADPQKKDVA